MSADPRSKKWVSRPDGWVLEDRVVHEPGRGIGWRKGTMGHITTIKVSKLKPDEKSAILLMSEKGRTVDEIAKSLDRSKATISRFIADMADTSILAKATLRAGAAALAERVIKRASVTESIEVLSRPGIDVLQPVVQKGAGSGGGGFRVSVGVGSCGTVVQVEGGVNAVQLPAGSTENGPGYPERPQILPEYAAGSVGKTIEVQGAKGPDGPVVGGAGDV